LIAGMTGLLIWRGRASRDPRQARHAFAAAHYDEARAALQRWLRASPNSAEAHFLMARVDVSLGLVPDAVVHLRQAKELGYPPSELSLVQAIVNALAGRHPEAEPVLRAAFEEARGPDPQLDEALAQVYLETYNLPRAAAVIERWIRDVPDDPKPYLWRTELDSRVERGAGLLIKDYREALKRDPKLVKAHFGLAEALREEHRNAEAAAEYAAYLALKPDDPAGHLGAGRCALGLGDEATAIRHFDRVLALDPGNAAAHKERAEIDLRAGAEDSALRHLDRAVALDPYDPAIRYSRGLVLSRLGRLDDAKAERAEVNRLRADLDVLTKIQQQLVLSPHDRRLQIQIAQWMFAHGHAKEGLNWAEGILRSHPGDPETSGLLASYYQRQGDAGLANYYRAMAENQAESSPPKR
jgi:predicted Zn-dependent protease